LKAPWPIQAVVFDMDGLLVDTEVLCRDAMMEATRRLGLELPMDVFLTMVGSPQAHTRAVAMKHFGEGFDCDGWIADTWALAHARIDLGVALKAGVTELLDALEAADIPRAIATSSTHATVERQLGPHALIPRFQAIVANGDYARGKPSPDPFLVAAERLGVDPALCLALEDSHNGVRAAHAAGMMTIMAPDLLEATPEIAALCIGVVDTLHEVRALFAASPEADR
jgi:HAD superfamily hydrolase (TIGR01509 family)